MDIVQLLGLIFVVAAVLFILLIESTKGIVVKMKNKI